MSPCYDDGSKARNHLTSTWTIASRAWRSGPNGAGKTTLPDVIGKVEPTSGRVVFGKDTSLVGRRENEIAALGVGRKFQTPSIFANLSVWENLELSCFRPSKGVFATLRSRLDMLERSRIEETPTTIGLADKARDRAGGLSHGEKQWLEIGMVIVQQSELLLVDEPVAGMTDEETEKTARLLRRWPRTGPSLVIEHDMEFVRSIARTVTVLHEGSVLCEGPGGPGPEGRAGDGGLPRPQSRRLACVRSPPMLEVYSHALRSGPSTSRTGKARSCGCLARGAGGRGDLPHGPERGWARPRC